MLGVVKVTNSEAAALDLLRDALESWEGITLQPPERSDRRPDLEIEVDGETYQLELRIWGGKDHATSKQRDQGPHATIWVLPRGAPDVHERLRNENANFIDLTGTVRLSLPGLYLDRSDLEPAIDRSEGETRNPFSDRASRIPRLLFRSFPRDWSIQELASTANVSIGLVSYVVKALTRRDLLEVESVGREKRVRLASPEPLVLQWTGEYTWRRNGSRSFRAPIGDVKRFLRRLPKTIAAERWALTLQAGASLVAPHATWDSVHVYVDVPSLEDLERVGADSGWSADEMGRVVLLKPHYADSFLFDFRKKNTIPVVSDLQLILDLWHYPNRGREQAEILLELHTHAK